MLGGLDFVSLFRPGDQSFALNSCYRDENFDGKNSGPEEGTESNRSD